MKKFKFTLKALLTIRENKEKLLKIEMGKILNEIEMSKNIIKNTNESISDVYDEQSALITMKAQNIQTYPAHVKGLKAKIEQQENILFSLQKKYEQKAKELTEARADVKVIEKLKEKQLEEYRRLRIKEEFKNIDDINVMRFGVSE